jgi:DNA-binding NarL/FixJ family response regulator
VVDCRASPSTRILIADEHQIVRRAVRDVIETRSDWAVCAETDGAGILKLACEHRPDVTVMEFAWRGQDGVSLLRRLAQVIPNLPILIFTARDDGLAVASAVAAGAWGCVLKSEPEDELVAAIEALADRRFHLSSMSWNRVRAQETAPGTAL